MQNEAAMKPFFPFSNPEGISDQSLGLREALPQEARRHLSNAEGVVDRSGSDETCLLRIGEDRSGEAASQSTSVARPQSLRDSFQNHPNPGVALLRRATPGFVP